jgi:NAD(P)H-dependent FMN reductase
MYKLKIIISSTRPERKGPLISNWVLNISKEYKEFEVEVLDLKEINLPFLDEPEHPMLKHYHHDHTKQWSKTIEDADAFIVVTPEYNYGYSAPLKNAIDFLYREWNYKPVALVSYGGIAAGTRAVQMLKQVFTALKMMPLAESVNIPFFPKYINENEIFTGDEVLEKSANTMFKELVKWTKSLKQMRG